MEQAVNAGNGSRRDEDIALDLLKFVAAATGTGRPTASSAGFVPGAGTKADDQVTQLLALYSKCLRTVQAKGEAR
jgi:hypothetical protein